MSSSVHSRLALSLLAIGIWAASWTLHADPWQTDTSPASTRYESFGGVWSLNREASQVSERGNAPPRGANGLPGRSGGRQGGRGFGSRGGGNPEHMQAIANYLRSLMEPSERLTIVVRQTSVGFTDADGRTVTLHTNNKSVDERAENGLLKLKRKSRWDRSVLVSEIEIENGPQLEHRFELFRDGEQLRVSTRMSGGFGGRGERSVPPVLHVYDRERPQ